MEVTSLVGLNELKGDKVEGDDGPREDAGEETVLNAASWTESVISREKWLT